ncbi:MAG TPA: serine hydrolase domain-containing protein, partial [Allosphingosinicella sp.]
MGFFVRLLGAALVLTPAPALAQAVPVDKASKSERFHQGVRDLHRKYQVPAVSVAVYSTKGLEAAETIGVRRVGEAAPVQLSDRFYLASVTKPFTATLGASMVEAGLIQWSTTPADIWPAQSKRMHPLLRRVTLAQLLSSKAGIPSFTNDSEIGTAPITPGSPREQRAAFAQWILARPPASQIGKHVYSNAGFGVAAAMLEKVGGKSWEDLIRERVFRPLNLTSCGFGWPRTFGDQPHGHIGEGAGFVIPAGASSASLPSIIAPGGDIHCNLTDLGRFGEAHMLGTLGRHQLLRTETFKLIHGSAEDYVLGWGNEPIGSQHLGGVTDGWQSMLYVSPSRQIVVAAATNAYQRPATRKLLAEVT